MGSTDIACAMATGATWMRVPESIRVEYIGELPLWIGGKDLILYAIGALGVDGARYQALEFAGPAVEQLSMHGRFTMANMAIECGAKAGTFATDRMTDAYVAAHPGPRVRDWHSEPWQPDAEADYAQVVRFDVHALQPQIACPYLPDNVCPVSEAGDVRIDQVVIGSCTNGRIEDLREACNILRGHEIHPDVRCIVLPGSPNVVRQAAREGLLDVFLGAGAAVSTPTCGPCLGGHMGVLAAGERAVSTTNRNFKGRMGHPDSEVYLAGPAVAAASAIAGRIASPEEVLR
jgi:3-isopropylmalate/(R)-2-methylmalate dehydratase large subunit